MVAKKRKPKMDKEQRAFYNMFRQRSLDDIGQAMTTLRAMEVKMNDLGLTGQAKWAQKFRLDLAKLQLDFVAGAK